MSDADPFNLPNLAQIIDTYMHRILDSGEDPVDVLLDLMGALIVPPLFEHLWCVGELYGNLGLLSDIVEAYPVDYGANAETIAAREIRDAARDWLAMPRTVEGMERYLEQWDARLEALPATHGGRIVRRKAEHAADPPATNA
ncbi:hypothetical protein [Micromonospora sp. NPDC050200]|uniref:hypothetical protein n=1 Tax=Micromonospora sp. NPDC050200 TaxID=3155664 RepID=UPI0033E09491